MSALAVPPLPFTLVPSRVPWEIVGADGVRASAEPGTDIFVPPFPDQAAKLDAATLLGEAPQGDFQLSARVTVGFRATFDAGVLLVWHDEQHWAKLCFEAAPNGSPTVVSVVNRTVSDDANAFTVVGATAWLRISRVDGIYLFHASHDGRTWDMVRIFGLDSHGSTPQVGFEVQSPTGDGCEVTFDEITFAPTRLTDPRDGS
jgi:regulation of enolase protein 1 (concanavalin A-like superfamily)